VSAVVGYLAIGALSFVALLPETLLLAIARAWGRIGPALQRKRAALGRRNLARVYAHRDGVEPSTSMLDRGVQQLFEHHLRFYIETARAPRHARTIIATRVDLEDEQAVRTAFVRGERGAIFLAAHFGAIELPGSILADRSGMRPVAPMEELGNAVLQRWMLRVRGDGLGLRIVPARGAAAILADELSNGGIVGLVGDRNISGRGVSASLFGAPARLPIGPGLLAVEHDARLFVAAVIREEGGRYTGYIRHIAIPDDGDRMERTRAALAGVAHAFEELIAKAPEQWWTLFYPIWEDARP
jgi:lauroyl/myristoyl acyltransferase